jgi:hypothetical protein
MHINFWFEYLKRRYHLEYLGVEGSIILSHELSACQLERTSQSPKDPDLLCKYRTILKTLCASNKFRLIDCGWLKRACVDLIERML